MLSCPYFPRKNRLIQHSFGLVRSETFCIYPAFYGHRCQIRKLAGLQIKEVKMIRLRRTLMFVLMLALMLPVWSAASAASLSTEQKFEVLKQKGIFTGFDDGSARLGDPMTREQFAAVLARLWGLKDESPSKATYFDVLRTRWSFGTVEAVTKAGLMTGMGGGFFGPASNVTVEQLATVLVRAYGYSGASGSAVSGKVSSWARTAVGIALDRGFIPAQNDYTAPATRGLLVEAAYAAYEQTNGTSSKLKVGSVQPLSNNTIRVTLKEAVGSVSVSNFSLRDDNGHTVAITDALLSSDGKTVTVVTAQQIAYVIHTLYVDGDGWRYTALPVQIIVIGDSVSPTIVSLNNNAGRLLQVTFSEPVSRATATDPNNYSIVTANLNLLSFALSDDGKTVSIYTSRQQQGTTYRLSVKGVQDLAGNTMAARSDLYFSGIDDQTKPTIVSATSGNNGTVVVVFSEPVDAGGAKNTANYRIDGGLKVTGATLASDGRTVMLSTSEQSNGRTYKLTVRNVADLYGNVMDAATVAFAGANDHAKPYVSAVLSQNNTTVRLQFSEKVNAQQAANAGNYSIDGLPIYSAYPDPSGDVVYLNTASQQGGVQYRLSVWNIADSAGNVMDPQSGLTFIGQAADQTPPAVTGVTAGVRQVVLTFSEPLDAASAAQTANYFLSGNLGVPSKAAYDDAKRTVTLTTADQTPGASYTVTINNVKDRSGLALAANTQVSFNGVGTPAEDVSLQSLTAVNQNTVEAKFSRALSDEEAGKLKLEIVKRNRGDWTDRDWQSFSLRKPGTDNVIRFQFRTEDDPNPALFTDRRSYVGEVTGIDALNTDRGANRKTFRGTKQTNEAPSIAEVKVLNGRSVKVTFSEPVRNVAPEGFRLFRADGSAVAIGSSDVNDKSRIVTEAVLYLNDDLHAGDTYRLQPQGSITDAAGWNAIRTTGEGSQPYEVAFRA